jgi:hypothetical protein
MLLLLRGKDETPDIEDLGSVLRGSSIQNLSRISVPLSLCSLLRRPLLVDLLAVIVFFEVAPNLSVLLPCVSVWT